MSGDRLAKLAHYIIWRCNPADLGSVKLNKVLWFSDVECYRSFGSSITGAMVYEKRQFGPVPKNILSTLRSLEGQRKIAQSTENYYGFPKNMLLSLEKPELSDFSADEIATVDAIADAICRNYTAQSISDLSHDALWDEAEIGADISVAAAAIIPGEITADDMTWAEKALA